jgi:predicted dehydrogenase
MIRVGVIGLGFGAAVHVPALKQIPGVEVVALGGRRPEKAVELALRHGVPLGGTIDDVFAAQPDAVTIALPPAQGAALARRALDAGCAVLAEKPLAETAARAAALAEAAKGKTTAVGFELAELDCFRCLKKQAEDGLAPEAIRISWRTRSYAHERGRWSWKTDRAQHGGVMNLLGSHIFYLLEWLHGPLIELEARYFDERTRAFAPSGSEAAEDRAEIRARSAGGVPIEIELDNAAGGAGLLWETASGGEVLRVEEKAGLNDLQLTRIGEGRAVVARDTTSPGIDWRIEPFRRLAFRFALAVRDRQNVLPGFDSGARVQYLLEAASQSARLGRKLGLNASNEKPYVKS